MAQSTQIIKVEEHGDITLALIITKDYPFIAEIVEKQLTKLGCSVHNKPQKDINYDYLLVIGETKSIKQYLRKVKQYGKALYVVSEGANIKNVSQNVTIYALSATRSFTPNVISNKIVRKLFKSKPYKKTKQHTRKKVKQQKKREKKNRLPLKRVAKVTAIISAAVLILASPVLVLISSVLVNIYSLQHLFDSSLDSQKRKQYLSWAEKSNDISGGAWNIVSPVLSFVFPSGYIVLDSSLEIVELLTRTASEIAAVTESLAKQNVGMFEENDISIIEILPMLIDSTSKIEQHLASIELALKNIAAYKDSPLVSANWHYAEKLIDIRESVYKGRQFLLSLPEILGEDKEKTYLILFQNNFELRPTGGFIGSFAVVTFKNGMLKNIDIQDVYEADGQLKGNVDPPKPIVKYLNQPNWFLRDSNWTPDFAFSAEQAEWFLDKEIGYKVDGVIAIDLTTLQTILRSFGPVYVPDYDTYVTAEDFFLKLQSDTHDKFFPGSSKKKNLLVSLTNALIIEFKNKDIAEYAPLLLGIKQALDEKHILVYFHEKSAQSTVEQLGWSGRLVSPPTLSEENTAVLDYTMLVDANVGVNKVNYYIKREFIESISLEQNTLTRSKTIYYKNTSPVRKTTFSGTYANYARVFMPLFATLDSVSINGSKLREDLLDVEKFEDKKSVGFLVEILPKHEAKVRVRYTLPLPERQFTYQLMVQKQPGTDKDPFVFKIDNSASWSVSNTNISSLPYLSNLASDELIIVDFGHDSR